MRAVAAGVMATGLVGLGLAVMVAGRGVTPVSNPLAPRERVIFGPPIPPDFAPLEASLHPSAQPARPVEPDVVAPPQIEYGTLVRAAPRNPLSDLSQALPPKPREGGTLLYRPVATASAEFESMGYRVAIAGTESIRPEETCTHDRTVWPCGMRARSAVRMWLRGRALACDLPAEPERNLLVVECRLGAQDVGAWLVSNGWARAAKGSRYEKAEAVARDTGMGIFGAPYSTETGAQSGSSELPSQSLADQGSSLVDPVQSSE
jgi:endonuclease YncB( thermonuclease family)